MSSLVKQIRADTSEYLYSFLQSTDALEIDGDAESILLETEWCVEKIKKKLSFATQYSSLDQVV
jgi:hypothetical protein